MFMFWTYGIFTKNQTYVKKVVYKCDVIEKARVKGEAYTNYKGNAAGARPQRQNYG